MCADATRCFQIMVPMRDGVRLNTFVFPPESGGSRWPVVYSPRAWAPAREGYVPD